MPTKSDALLSASQDISMSFMFSIGKLNRTIVLHQLEAHYFTDFLTQEIVVLLK